MRRRTAGAALAVAAAAGLGLGVAVERGVGGGAPTRTVQIVQAGRASDAASVSGTRSVGAIYRDAVRGVVEVTTSSGSSGGFDPFGQGDSQQAQGTGFEIDTRGDIVTNAHVVSGASSVTVTTHDGRHLRATVVGTDEDTDVALLHVSASASSLHPIAFDDSRAVRVGDAVLAIGDPFGLTDTLTTGVVSAVGRTITSPNGRPIPSAIQTDAAINHGNSGGPLLDASGRVIGITSQIESGDQSSGNVGIGFAVPSATVRSVVSQLLANGKVQHPFMGVSLVRISPAEAQAAGLTAGIAITDVVSGSPADHAGLRGSTGTTSVGGTSVPTGGDVITALDGSPVGSTDDFVARIGAHRVGDEVTLTVSRDGRTRTVRVTLGTQP